ncbi:hypothetical protein [Butyrivibrio sp. FCS014]|uniref:hypothetical protein n=1 Tax=Butyrivibrio sp. FCS014 TaxID=1408304 RepID=UPI0012DFC207|nr:hypothetical protein [Butyrivibrio sp. FCS014]
MKDIEKTSKGLVHIISKYIVEHPEIVRCTDNIDCTECEQDCYFNTEIPKNMELWDYEIQDVDAEFSHNEVRINVLVVATIYVSLPGDYQDDGDEISTDLHLEVVIDLGQFQIKSVGVTLKE